MSEHKLSLYLRCTVTCLDCYSLLNPAAFLCDKELNLSVLSIPICLQKNIEYIVENGKIFY